MKTYLEVADEVFKKGEVLYKVDEDKLVDALINEIEKL